MEQWDIYDRERRLTGRTMKKMTGYCRTASII